MTEPVFYMRGFPPQFRDAVSEEMVEDLKAILQATPDLLDAAAVQLGAADGYLDTTSLNDRLRSILPDDAPVDSVRRVILNIKSEDVGGLIKRLQRLQESGPEDFPLSADEVSKLDILLPRLLKPVPALRRFRKAERLSKTIGQSLEDIQLICDLRPVFDEERQDVEGLIPYTHLKVVATGGDGLPNVFEAELSAQQVRDLAELAEKAIRKLSVLRDKAEQWARHGMPNVPLTRVKEKGSTDD